MNIPNITIGKLVLEYNPRTGNWRTPRNEFPCASVWLGEEGWGWTFCPGGFISIESPFMSESAQEASESLEHALEGMKHCLDQVSA